MKVLLLNTSERTGGAAVASNRLMRALQKQGIEVKMLVRDKQTNNESVISINSSVIKQKLNWIRFVWERFVIFICNCFSRKNLFQVSIANTGTDITKLSAFRNADIIHLHWINQGFLSLSDLKKIIDSGKPIVWTMHDLWSATSICHYPGECLKYQKHCQECPMLSHPVWDLSHQTFKQKEKLNWAKVHFVGCSRWITHLGMQSVLLQSAKFHSIPNALPASFSPTNKCIARQAFGLPANKFLILFGAADWDLNSIFREGTDALWKIALLFAAVAAFYPKIGFISRQLALNGGKAADRSVISEYMGQLGYVKETDAGDRMTFRMEKTSGRLARMFEDRITITFSTEDGVAIDGLRKDVARIAGSLEFRFNSESE